MSRMFSERMVWKCREIDGWSTAAGLLDCPLGIGRDGAAPAFVIPYTVQYIHSSLSFLLCAAIVITQPNILSKEN